MLEADDPNARCGPVVRSFPARQREDGGDGPSGTQVAATGAAMLRESAAGLLRAAAFCLLSRDDDGARSCIARAQRYLDRARTYRPTLAVVGGDEADSHDDGGEP